MSKPTQAHLVMRWVLYVIGLLVLALGIILNTKATFGVTPIVSVPYCISLIRGLDFGNASLVMYVVLALVEYLLKWDRFRAYDLLQIPLSIAFTRLFNVFGALLPSPASMPGRILCLVLAIVCTGLGAAMSLNARLVPNPGDGIVQAISDRVGKKVGTCKNCFDLGCVALTATIGLVSTGHLVGIGMGTVCAMLGVGRVMAAYNALFGRRAAELMGLDSVNGKG